MHNLRCGLMEGMTELRLLMTKCKTIVLLIAVSTLVLGYVHPLGKLAKLTSVEFSIAEPFVLLMNSGSGFGSPHFFIYLFFCIILSDFPAFTSGFRYRIIRMNRTGWWIGQLIAVISFTLIYMVLIIVLTVLPIIGRCSPGNDWSQSMHSIMDRTKLPQEIKSVLRLGIDPEIGFLQEYSAWSAFGLTIWYTGAYLLVSALFLSAFHALLPRLRPAGVGILIVNYLLVDVIMFGVPYRLWGLSLAILSQLSSMNYDFNYLHSAPSLELATGVWIGLICIMAAFTYISARFLRLDSALEKEE